MWIPLNAETEKTQVLSLSFMGDLRFESEDTTLNTYEVTLNELIKKQPIKSMNQTAFSIN